MPVGLHGLERPAAGDARGGAGRPCKGNDGINSFPFNFIYLGFFLNQVGGSNNRRVKRDISPSIDCVQCEIYGNDTRPTQDQFKRWLYW